MLKNLLVCALDLGMKYMCKCECVWLPSQLVTSARYLRVHLDSSFRFKCSFAANKAKFYKTFNCIFGKIGRTASEEVIFVLIKSKCLPILLYGTEACPENSAMSHSLQVCLNRAVLKIFGALSKDMYKDICKYFGIWPIEERISARRDKFKLRYSASESVVCRAVSKLR